MDQPDLVVVEVPAPVDLVEIQIAGLAGAKGDTGNPGIIVSATPPPDPQENDLWLDIS